MSVAVGTQRQERLLGALVCPACRAPVTVVDPVRRDDGVAAADLTCPNHGRVGVVDRHRPSFLDRELDAIAESRVAERRSTRRAETELVTMTGRWWPLEAGWAGAAETGVSIVVAGDLTEVVFELLADEWSPPIEVLVDGSVVHRVRPDEGGDGRVATGPLAPALHTVEVRVAEPRPDGRVVVVDTRVEALAVDTPATPFIAVDRGNAFPLAFLDLVADLPDDAFVLDCGGGDRQLGDPRVFNLEYLPYDAPDLYADGLALPFADDTFDLILSQAVLEHVPDPQRATDEMRRVLRPEGRIFCEIAFMQPLHAVPSHYFNVTPHGAEHLFRDWDIETLDWFGGIDVTLDWWSRILELDARWEADKLSQFRDLSAEVAGLTSHDQLRNFASGVLVIATKPLGSVS